MLTSGMYSLIHFISSGIALDLFSKVESPDLWEHMEEYWQQFAGFLPGLASQKIKIWRRIAAKFEQPSVEELITDNDWGNINGFTWPQLIEIGRVAFRSQV